jgi:hypothetical protein
MFCRIYVNASNLTRQHLLFQLCDLLNEKLINNSYIENDTFALSVTNNDEYNSENAQKFPGGFLFFPFSIEVDFYIEDKQEAANRINDLLSFLWTNKYSAIASASFEELLLEKGGYGSENVPWINVRRLDK